MHSEPVIAERVACKRNGNMLPFQCAQMLVKHIAVTVLEIRSNCIHGLEDVFRPHAVVVSRGSNNSSEEDTVLIVDGRFRVCTADDMCNALDQGIGVP